MASIPSNGYAEVMAGTNNYSGSNSYDGSCPRTAIPPVIGNDLCNKTYVDAATGGGIIGTLTDKGSLITADGTQPVIFDQNPYQTALTTTTVYDWNSLAIGQSRQFTTTVPTLIPLGAGITITYSGTDSIKGNITAVAGTTITLTITALAHIPYATTFLIQTSAPDTTAIAGAVFDGQTFSLNPAVTTPTPPQLPAYSMITDGECNVFINGGVPANFFFRLLGTGVQRGDSSTQALTNAIFGVANPTPITWNGANGGCFFNSASPQIPSPLLKLIGVSPPLGADFQYPIGGGFIPPDYAGYFSGYTLTYGSGSIVIDDDICLIADPLSSTGIAWGVINTASIGAVTSVSGGVNIVMSGTVPAPIVNLRDPLTAQLNMGAQSLRDSAGAVGTSGQILSCGIGGQTLWTSGAANPNITDTNTNATFYPTFVAGSGVQPLLADIATSQISLNPSNGNFNVVDTIKITQSELAIGKTAGVTTQASNAIAIGLSAGNNNQAANCVAIGGNSGALNQQLSAVAVGSGAGGSSQGQFAVAVGVAAGSNSQGTSAVAVGNQAGFQSQGSGAIAMGSAAGTNGQGQNGVALGNGAGGTNQGANAVSVGVSAGGTTQGASSVAVGNSAGGSNQGVNAVAVGLSAGQTTQSTQAVAVGAGAGLTTQGQAAVAVGLNAGAGNQGANAVAVGRECANSNQGAAAVAIGNEAGQTQGANAVAVGHQAGKNSQGAGGIAIGNSAGQGTTSGQGANAIAIGNSAAVASQTAGSICLNASGSALNPSTAGLYIDPIRSDTINNFVGYDTTTKELFYDSGANNFSVISLFTDATARNTGLPSPYLGQFCFLTNTSDFQYYNAGWNTLFPSPAIPTVTGFTLGSNYEVIYVDATNNVIGSPSFFGSTIVRFYPTTTTSGTIQLNKTTAITYLVVGGGGGGGGSSLGVSNGGGGGAGGYLTSTGVMNGATSYSLQVGGGSAGGVAGAQGVNGTNSTLAVVSGTITATGGGGGGGTTVGNSGGSGGGGTTTNTSGGSGTAGQGNNGGTGVSGGGSGGGGGGGASAVGTNGASGGTGGAGTVNTITGASITYAGGGAGGTSNASPVPAGGAGGGGSGGFNGGIGSETGQPGTDGLGGGGGGGGYPSPTSFDGGKGGAGVVIVRFPSYI